MKRKTLDVAFSAGGVIFSILLLVVGLILNNQRDFAETYVRSQLDEQQITFPTKEALAENTDEVLNEELLEKFGGDQAKVDAFLDEKNLTSEASSACLNAYAGQQMLTGKQAECYAEHFIKLHAAESSIVDGVSYSYATIGRIVGEARDAVAAAKEAGAPQEEIDELQAKADTLQRLRVDTLLRADTLRGLLLTSYGFSVFGERAGQAAWVCYIAAIVLFLLSIAGFVHAFTSKKADDLILVAEHKA
ncbi:MAG: hypothetical protein Q7V88_06335 [Actinomycetota bacterium]|nr:hypothetical protein [Actinomycetota bacterium]